jgi:hypothetical protein
LPLVAAEATEAGVDVTVDGSDVALDARRTTGRIYPRAQVARG